MFSFFKDKRLSQRNEWQFTLAIFFTLLILGTTALYFHEPWRDEAYTWLLISNSSSLHDLYYNPGFVGHPIGYFVICFLIAKINSSYFFLRFIHLIFSIATITILVHGTRISKASRVLFALGFFPLFQYGVIARSYNFLWFFFAIYLALSVRFSKILFTRLLILAVFCQFHLYSLVMAVLFYGYELFIFYKLPSKLRNGKSLFFGSFVLFLSVITVLVQLIPKGQSYVHQGIDPRDFLYYLADGFFPEFNSFPANRNLIQIPVGIALLCVSYFVLHRNRPLLFLYTALTICLSLVFLCAYGPFRWHHGFYYFTFVGILYLYSFSNGFKFSRWQSQGVFLIFFMNAALGIRALALDFIFPYSGAEIIAKKIRDNHLEKYPIIGLSIGQIEGNCFYSFNVDSIQPALAALGGKSIFDPDTATFETYEKHYMMNDFHTKYQISTLTETLSVISHSLNHDLVIIELINDSPESCREKLRDDRLTQITTKTGNLDFGENLSLYLFKGS